MAYPIEKIRNICLLGHGGDGKTSLVESLLYRTGGTDRLGKIAEGNTVSDYDPEEIKRQISIQASLAPVEYEDHILNFIDTPGFFDFDGEVAQALRVADCGVIVVAAKSGCAVGTEKAWKRLSKTGLPRFFYISKIDEENADYEKAYQSLRDAFGISVTPFVIPLMEGGKPTGVINLINRKAFKAEGKVTVEVPVPEDQKDQIETLRGALMESVAETSEELMDKFFEGEEFTKEELLTGLRSGIRDGSLAPVVCGSALTGVGTMQLLYTLVNFAPNPGEVRSEHGVDGDDNPVELKYDPNGKPVALVFKTVADQYGRFSFFKVISGKITTDMLLQNTNTETQEKMGHIYIVKGKKNIEVKEIGCGDIGAVSKLNNTKTGDTLCDPSLNIKLDGIHYAEPCYSRAILAKAKGGEEKIAAGLTRLKDEDPTFTVVNDPETKQMVISGAGDIHIDVLCSKLKSKFGVEVELSDPKVAYRETIRKKVTLIEGNHKKQSGGHGQYGNVKMNFEPIPGDGFEFAEEVFGGSVPKNFFPAVEKGIREAMEHGVLAGFPMVGMKATLVDGKYHPVDSNELSFKMAARLAYKAGIPQASPVILEPVGSLKVYIPDSYMGDIIGDLNKRRGRVMGMNPAEDGLQLVEAEVPMSEVADYAITLRSMTQGRGSFSVKFERYEAVPPEVQEKIIADAKFVDDEE
ncbi:MAG: elongation factor G [Clostridia bacterium]|nr:elongation factor G [Clostridia bacterium]MDD7672161.1 elongation factor G [Clostridia bacterium]MDY2930265.1 elongation factor G [Clostridiaceae bacterium]